MQEKTKILFVDDELDILKSLQRTFRNTEFELFCTSSIEEAKSILVEENIHLICSDLKMPSMSGIDFLKKVRKIQPDSRRLMLSAHCESADLLKVINEKVAHEYLLKPCKKGEILEAIRKQCGMYHVEFEPKKKLILKNKLLERELEELRVSSSYDSLTSVLNRKAVFEKLKEEIARCDRKKFPLSIMMLDINDLKVVNDQFGHIEGDFLIKTVGNSIQGSLRKYDSAGRYGGDEFLLVLPHADLGIANSIGERIQKILFQSKGAMSKYTMSISYGCVEYNGETLEDIVAIADERMYQNKVQNKKSA